MRVVAPADRYGAAPVPADQVQLYTEAPHRPYERIAIVSASSKRSLSFSFEGKAEVVVRRLKEEAGKLGANGVLLEEISDESGAAIGADVGTLVRGPARHHRCRRQRLDAHCCKRYGRAIAIYLPDRLTPPRLDG